MRKYLVALLLLVSVYTLAQEKYTPISECVVENGVVKGVIVDYNTATAAKSIIIGGVRKDIEQVYPLEGKEYAASKPWYINNQKLSVDGAEYIKYGLPRVLGTTEVKKLAVYDNITIFVEAGGTGNGEVIYVPVRRGCEFQPYQIATSCADKVILTSNLKEVKPGGTVSISANASPIGKKYTYEWTVTSGSIIGSAKEKTVAVKADAYREDDIMLRLEVSILTGKCNRKSEYITIPLVTPKYVSKAKKVRVEVTNWNQVATKVDSLFWSKDIEQQILQQLTAEEYQYAKSHISNQGWSAPVRALMQYRNFEKATMARLKTYQVASFDDIKGGSKNGKVVILVVPYEENKSLINSKKPLSDFYLLMYEKVIKPL